MGDLGHEEGSGLLRIPALLVTKLLQLAWHLAYADFVVLHARYRSAGNLLHPTYTRRCFLGGSKGFFILP
jgi:hypothetical protein